MFFITLKYFVETICLKVGISIQIAHSFAMSKAVDRETGFISPCGESKKLDFNPFLTQFLFISARKKQMSRNSEC